MNFIKNLFQGKVDDEVHKQFKRFSKGTFQNRAVVEMSVGKDLKIKTSFEFTNEFARYLTNTIKGKTHVTGGIITTKDIRQSAGFDICNVKQFAGVKTFQIDTEISREELLKCLESFPDAVFCLSFVTDFGVLKTKVKTPKAAKSKKGDNEEIKADYCSFTTKYKDFKNEFAFDVKEDFKKFKATHDFIINELVVPKEYQNDLEKARIFARRRGKIIRKLEIDGKTITKEINFEA